MGQRKGAADYFRPVRGLVTEASETNFPQDAAVDVLNTEITKNGVSRRRLGLEVELYGETLIDGFTELDRQKGVYSTYLWKLQVGADTLNLRILQVGSMLYVIEDATPLSTAPVYAIVDLASPPYVLGTPGSYREITTACQYAYGAGFLIVTNENCEPFIMYTPDDDIAVVTISVEVLDLKVRTRELLTPYTEGDNYGSELSAQEEFNLFNSGWPWGCKASWGPGDAVFISDPLAIYKTLRGDVYPSHTRLFHAMKLTTAAIPEAVGAYDPTADLKINFGNTIPPLGHYIHSAYEFDSRQLLEDERVTVAGLSFTPTIKSTGTVYWQISTRASCCGFLNGHAFYGDIDQSNKARILVSQLVTERAALAKCYQDADPAADEINDLIATDGFTLRPVGMGKPLAMRETSKGLIVFCSNGVWAIRGGAAGFSATDFEIVKLADMQFNSPNSVVVVDDVVFFCAEKGIYTIVPNDFGELKVQSITDNTIKTLYQGYGSERIADISVVYVKDENYIYWCIPNAPTDGDYRNEIYEVLVLNLELQGFFPYSFSDESDRPALHVPMAVTNTRRVEVLEAVTVDAGETIVTAGGVPVTITKTVVTQEREQLAFFASYRPAGIDNFVAVMSSGFFYDWYDLGDPYKHDYDSYIEFAYVAPQSYIGGVSAPYIHSFFKPSDRVQLEPDWPLFSDITDPEYAFERFRIDQVYLQVFEDKS